MKTALQRASAPLFLGRQTGKQGVLSIIALTLASKAMGFIREMAVAYLFGATGVVDAFVVAMNIYNLSLGMVGNAFVGAGTPLLVEAGAKRGEVAQKKTFLSLLNLCLVASGVVAGAVALFAPGLVFLLAPRFGPEVHGLSVRLLWAMVPLALGMGGLFPAVAYLNGSRRFALAKAGDLMVNVVALGLLFLASAMGIYALALGWSMGYLLAGGVMIGVILKGFGWRPTRLWSREIKEFLKLSSPILVAYAATQVNVVVDRAFASSLAPGSIAALGYGWRLAYIPTVLGAALATVQLTRASEMAAAGNLRGLRTSTWDLLLKGALLTVPLSVSLIWLAKPVVQVAFQRGAFDALATTRTATAFLFYGFGIFPTLALLVLAASFRGMKDTKTPMVSGIAAVMVNLGLNVLLIRPMGLAGLALASSISAGVNSALMGATLWRKT